jgi:phosphoglycolate phosphatase
MTQAPQQFGAPIVPAPPDSAASSPAAGPCTPSVLRLRAVIFDFDGTLAHTSIDFPQMRVRTLDYIREVGLWSEAVASAPYILEAIDRAAQHLSAAQRESFLAGTNAILEDIEVQAASAGKPFDGVPDALAALKAAGLQTAVITRNCCRALATFLNRHPLPLDLILTRDDVPRVKPDPDHIVQALQRLRLGSHEAVMIGDHRTDVQCAVAAGVLAYGVLTAGTSAEELRAHGACHVAPAVPDVVDVLLRGIAGGADA